ncbi:MAG: protein kinase [Sandaracinaceae bacterium]|nr:protein kinase [Sandaracinaceae bacterium]
MLGEGSDTWKHRHGGRARGEPGGLLWRAGARGGTPCRWTSRWASSSGICEALHHAHEAEDRGGNPPQIVQRDVTAHNIMIIRDGVAKLMDFGIAQTNANWAEQRGVLRGTLAATWCSGRWLDRRADIFALGGVLYELTTGTRASSAVRTCRS